MVVAFGWIGTPVWTARARPRAKVGMLTAEGAEVVEGMVVDMEAVTVEVEDMEAVTEAVEVMVEDIQWAAVAVAAVIQGAPLPGEDRLLALRDVLHGVLPVLVALAPLAPPEEIRET